MGTPPSPLPPNVATSLDQKAGEKPKTVRVEARAAREQRSAQCHGVIDPSGLRWKLDAIGRWRTTDLQAENAAIEVPFCRTASHDGPVEFRNQLSSRLGVFAEALTEKLMTYALNRVSSISISQVRASFVQPQRTITSFLQSFDIVSRGVPQTGWAPEG